MVADAGPAGVVLGAREHLRRSGVEDTNFRDLYGLAATIGRLIERATPALAKPNSRTGP